jgi:DmsE family decaheme c-type cytochrome
MMYPRHKNGGSALVVLSVLLAFLLFIPAVASAGDVDNETCAGCHDEIAEAFHGTPHGRYLSERPGLREFSCEGCHGSGLQHIEEGDPDLIVNPGKADQFSSQLCLTCHKDEAFDDWSFAHHNSADVSCSSCHQVHVTPDEVGKTSPELCYDCHVEVRAASVMPSHHPVAEGVINCVDCHNPHGSRVSLSLDESGRELCFRCHADIEGPYVYEHAPVNEDCMICHTPHGSVAPKLLKQNEPALCLNCHAMHFHATVQSVPGSWEGYPTQAPERAGSSQLDSFKKGMLTKCTQCHSMVHGSDLPSQAASTAGNGLTR